MRNSYEELYAMAKDLNIEKKQAYDVLLEHIMEHLWEEHRIKVENLVKEAKRLSIPRMPYPKLIPALRNSNVVKAYCGESFSLLLNDNGGVLSFGNNSHSQLGLGDSISGSAAYQFVRLRIYHFVQRVVDLLLLLTSSVNYGCGGMVRMANSALGTT